MIEYIKNAKAYKLKIGTYLQDVVLVTWPTQFGESRSKI